MSLSTNTMWGWATWHSLPIAVTNFLTEDPILCYQRKLDVPPVYLFGYKAHLRSSDSWSDEDWMQTVKSLASTQLGLNFFTWQFGLSSSVTLVDHHKNLVWCRQFGIEPVTKGELFLFQAELCLSLAKRNNNIWSRLKPLFCSKSLKLVWSGCLFLFVCLFVKGFAAAPCAC